MRNSVDDDYIESNTLWIAFLSNGEIVYQDDKCVDNEDSFTPLKIYCEQNNLFIDKFQIRFRSHIETVFENNDECQGFFFRKSIMAPFSSDKNFHRYIIGKVIDNIIYTEKWSTPEIIMVEQEIRSITESMTERSIIWKPSTQIKQDPK